MNGYFQLSRRDLINGVAMIAITSVLVVLAGVAATPGFDVVSADWGNIGKSVLNFSFVSLVSYLVKNLASNKQGEVVGIK